MASIVVPDHCFSWGHSSLRFNRDRDEGSGIYSRSHGSCLVLSRDLHHPGERVGVAASELDSGDRDVSDCKTMPASAKSDYAIFDSKPMRYSTRPNRLGCP